MPAWVVMIPISAIIPARSWRIMLRLWMMRGSITAAGIPRIVAILRMVTGRIIRLMVRIAWILVMILVRIVGVIRIGVLVRIVVIRIIIISRRTHVRIVRVRS